MIAPNDNDMQTDGGRPNKSRIRYTDDGRHDKVFWRVFDELAAATPTRTVNGKELKARLVSSNKFFVGDAILIIERMVHTGKLCNVAFDTYRRGEIVIDARRKICLPTS